MTKNYQPNETQAGRAFPALLTERYRPHKIEDFLGLDKPKRILLKLCDQPFSSAWFFLGNSGTGKTSMALALTEQMPGELHHIASRDCTLELVKSIAAKCHWMPRMANDWTPCKMHVVLIDEADQATYPAQLAFLSLLDATGFPPNTIFIFTGNSTANLEARFLSRCQILEFSSYGTSARVSDLLAKIWDAETGHPEMRPNFSRIVKESRNNVRQSLLKLQTQIMCG